MHWIYLSPHLDDAALSCGGLIWEQSQAGEQVEIWTICAGDPPDGPLSPFAQSLHERWQTGAQAIARRRAEDLLSCARLAATARHFSVPDCIYRGSAPDENSGETAQFYYDSEESLTGALHPGEESLIQSLGAELAQTLPKAAEVVCPLTLGGHVDHRLVRAAAERLEGELWYYADYPYILKQPQEVERLRQVGWLQTLHPVSPAGLIAWQDAVATHRSQISTFWSGEESMKLALKSYLERLGGLILWQKLPKHAA